MITPGDHYSPSTGSAVPTVVHGLCAEGDAVVVARGTYPDRYDGAEIVEYTQQSAGGRARWYLDLASGRTCHVRPSQARAWRATLAGQRDWPPSVVLGHNAPQLVRGVDTRRHRCALYAHNELLRTYSRAETRRALHQAERIICVSRFIAERTAARLHPRLTDRIRVVPNGVDTDAFRPRHDAERDDSRLQVLVVGRIVRDKGADVLLRALARTRRADIDVIVLGSSGFDPNAPLTAYERGLRELAGEVRGSVEFRAMVPRDRVAEAMRSVDVLVVPSRWAEPWALAVGEGLASGLAVVASDVGGIPEALGGSGVLVAPDDPDALAAVLSDLADDPERRRRLGAEAREYALGHNWAWSREQLDAALAD